MFPFREIKDLWVGGASLPLPFSTLKFALPLKDSNITLTLIVKRELLILSFTSLGWTSP